MDFSGILKVEVFHDVFVERWTMSRMCVVKCTFPKGAGIFIERINFTRARVFGRRFCL